MANQYIVRYGSTRNVGEFSSKASQIYARYDEVIVRTERGVEWGEVLCESNEGTRKVLGEKKNGGRILRAVTEIEYTRLDEVRQKEQEEFDGCSEMIRERNMQMQLVDVEHLFGGERVIFYYLAEKRVDFRELVKALAKRYRTRIEMRQIGVRDEAKLLADYGDCGKSVCCNTHLGTMPPVSMKMAKLQKATLDPSKISGRCGRLKCCLRYEYEAYEAGRRTLPPVGATVVTDQGEGRVLAQEVLAQKVLVSYDRQRQILTSIDDIVSVADAS